MQNQAVLKVVFVLCENMLTTSLSLPMEQLRAAESLARLVARERKYQYPRLKIEITSADGLPRMSHTGLSLSPDTNLDDVENPSIIFLPALWRNPQAVLRRNPKIVTWLQSLSSSQVLIAGVGTGCCFMAAAGLLNDKVATTHWHYFDSFEKLYPKVKLQRNHFITHADGRYCAGSVNSLGDLTIHFIRRFFNQSIALHVERNFFHDIRDAYDREAFSEHDDHAHADEIIIEAQRWLRDNIGQDLLMTNLATKLDLSRRNLDRRFKKATNLTPLMYLQNLRMNLAKDLIKSSNLDINEVMYECGYQDASYFSRLFKRHHGTSPKDYKSTVRAKLFNL
ncbi:MAG: transcriptional regulator GlxA family with amidase domain [Flavobacteriales bacterium]|jgi:transcriptional regulator GlxA family with amidase domain